MKKDTLLIIDLNKDYNIYQNNKSYINLNNGSINLSNCKQIYLKNYPALKNDIYKKLLKKFKKLIFLNSKLRFFYTEMEIFNLRNDKYVFLDRILNFLVIKKIILQKKIKKLEIISDNPSTLKIFDKLNLKVKKNDFSKPKLNFYFHNIKIIKFLIKTFCLIFFIKSKKTEVNNFPKQNNFYLSVYPNNYHYGIKNFFNKEKEIFNFLITDETHLNFNLISLIKYAKITEKKNITNVESYISFYDIFLLLLKHLLNLITFKKVKIDFNFDNLNLSEELNDIFVGSYINRSKLEIYSKALPRFFKNKNVSSIHLYLFEYSFGFYLIRKIKEFSKKIKIIGYQHGIFSNNLMWLDVINSLNFKNYYNPHKIYCLNKNNLRDYRLKYKNINISIIKRKKNLRNQNFINKIKINKNSNKILVLPGLHDTKDLYKYVKKKNDSNIKKIYYFKLHPKNKFNFSTEKKIQKIVKFEKYNFSEVIVSQTSSLHYEFLNSNRNFSIVDFDYKQNHVSSFLNKNKKINFLKY